MSTSSLRRQVKNIVHNYSEAEIKVREATSNDPWGPSSSLMSEIADLTYNVVAFSEIMSMVWRRLNDHGKNWRHVYKAMTLMEYLIKTGSERVAQQCRENIYAVQTLKDFQYIDRDGKDQGVNVREKAKQLVALLKDEERLKEERVHALKTKEKMAQTATASSTPSGMSSSGLTSSGMSGGLSTDAEQAWPQSSGEEDLQLQLALAMSKEEAEQVPSQYDGPTTSSESNRICVREPSNSRSNEMERKTAPKKEERLRRGDDLRLQMAIEESKRENTKSEESSLMDLADVFTPATSVAAADPWTGTVTSKSGPAAAGNDPWGGPSAPSDPWASGSQAQAPAPTTKAAAAGGGGDPWASAPVPSADPWAAGTVNPSAVQSTKATSDPWGESAPSADPWNAAVTPPSSDPWGSASVPPSHDPWSSEQNSDPWGTPAQHTNGTGDSDSGDAAPPQSRSPDSFDFTAVGASLPSRKTPESFLGPNAALVDLDSLVSQKPKTTSAGTSNPFLSGSSGGGSSAGGTTIAARGVSPTPPPPAPVSNPFGSTSVSPQPSAISLGPMRTSPVPPSMMMGAPPAGPPHLGMVQPTVPMGMQMPPQMSLGMVPPSTMGIPFGTVSPMSGAGGPMLMGAPHSQSHMMIGTPGMATVAAGNVNLASAGTTNQNSSTNPFLL
ncbi:epsin-1 isoform X2 [Erpetoichthys calabaricus]|uniref:ENTH domain-containing protein n=1 Tax=Erpetoichthys calabaricus TaxID=27687 RepID=A0A8C4XF32_ERPCA|nr:epsin-1 isoform X2 [Erpetoichthys calabaricus]